MDLKLDELMSVNKRMSVGVYIALEEELRYFTKSIEENLHIRLVEDSSNYTTYRIDLEHIEAELVIVCPDEVGTLVALSETEKILSKKDFDFFFNIGIAGGMSDDIRVGEILIPSVIDNYMENVKITDKKEKLSFAFSGDPYKPNFTLYSNIISATIKRASWYSEWLRDREECLVRAIGSNLPEDISQLISTKPNVKGGRLASGTVLAASSELKVTLKSNRDRKFLGVEMEAAGVAKACHQSFHTVPFLAIKAISDPASKKEKSILDNFHEGVFREWGMGNATTLFFGYLQEISNFWYKKNRNTNISDISNISSERISNFNPCNHKAFFLNQKYGHKKISGSQTYSDYFSKVTSLLPYEGNVFEETCEQIFTSQYEFPFNLVAEKGSGKSSFLSILYNTLCNHSDNRYSVLYINFRRLLRESDASIKECFTKIESCIKETRGAEKVIILDDIESINDQNHASWTFTIGLFENIKALEKKKIIFGSRKPIRADYPEIISYYNSPRISKQIVLTSVNVRNPVYNNLIESFINISHIEMSDQDKINFRKKIHNLNIYNLDLFILSSICSTLNMATYSEVKSLSEYLHIYCSYVISSQKNGVGITIGDVAKCAFNDFVNNHPTPYIVSKNLPTKVQKLLENNLVSGFLVAFYGINKLKSYASPKEGLHTFSYVYPDLVDHFFKEMVREDSAEQTRTFQRLKTLSDDLLKAALSMSSEGNKEALNKNLRGLTHCMYLIGRLDYSHEVLRDYLETFLSRVKGKDYHETKSKSRDFGLLTRTIYISLAYLGSENAVDEYVIRLIEDKKEDDLNRGFHLEYYGDQEYIADFGMNHKDRLESCDKTFTYLSKKIREQLVSPKEPDPLIHIEIHTILSLVQNRLKKESFTNYRNSTLQLVTELENSQLIKNDELVKYIAYMKHFLKKSPYNYMHVVNDVYGLKKLLRTGWKKRLGHLDMRLESVAEHSFGACFLAYFFLHEDSCENGSKIDKVRVINTLLIHDIAECYVGDLIDKTDSQRLEEKKYIEQISLVGTNEGLPNHREISELFNEMEGLDTVEGRVAKDFDKLENLFQLYLYKESLEESDFKIFKKSLTENITTNAVRKIRDNIITYFDENSVSKTEHQSVSE
jgi:5'-deoxynucleotidase YfbR-like HD superfamily hydrolase/nucleoside phosphorylase